MGDELGDSAALGEGGSNDWKVGMVLCARRMIERCDQGVRKQ